MVKCPYCGKDLNSLNYMHLKTHGKTRQDVISEFPELKKHVQFQNELGVAKGRKIVGYARD